MYAPYIKQEEPLKTECQHFLDCIRNGTAPMSCGERGTELVKILEASSESLRQGGAPVEFSGDQRIGHHPAAVTIARSAAVETPKLLPGTNGTAKKSPSRPARKAQIKIVLNGNGH